ncbi:MAG: CbtA family protein [Pikeienuella sp.]
MFTKIVTSALFAGFSAGVIAFALQYAFVQPILLHAEMYEGGELFYVPGAPAPAHVELDGGIELLRDALSAIFSALIYTGYGLVLIAGFAMAEMRGATVTARSGLIWGVCGFIAVQMAPAFGLAPELPGMSAADVVERQVWWFGTVIATGLGLWLIAFGRGIAMWAPAVILLLAPHVIGAPLADQMTGPTPPELASEFAARALGVGLAAWAVLGVLAAFFWAKENEDA